MVDQGSSAKASPGPSTHVVGTEPADATPVVKSRELTEARLIEAWDHPAVRFARRNTTPLAAASAFGIVVLKVFAVAQYNPRVAGALVGTAESPAIVLAVAVNMAQFAIAGLFAVAFWLAVFLRPVNRDLNNPIRGCAIVAALVCVVAVPALYLAPLAFWLVVVLGLKRVSRFIGPGPTHARSRAQSILRALISAAIWAITLGVILLLVVTPTPWMPAERVSLHDGQTVVAYVVRTDERWTVLLIDRGRSLRYVPTADVSGRQPCSPDVGVPTLLELINGSQLPQCYP
jgi:hypothetical protein